MHGQKLVNKEAMNLKESREGSAWVGKSNKKYCN